MPVFIEKRKHNRFDHLTSNIKYTKDPETPYTQALLINYSKNGIFFKTTEPIELDQNIFFRVDNLLDSSPSHKILNASQGCVRWMDQYNSQAHGKLYRYGIELSS